MKKEREVEVEEVEVGEEELKVRLTKIMRLCEGLYTV